VGRIFERQLFQQRVGRLVEQRDARRRAVFGGPGATVTVAGAGVSANNLVFNSSGYTIAGGAIAMSVAGRIKNFSGGNVTINSALAGASGLTVSNGPVTLGA